MSDALYTFLPWVKTGFSNAIPQLQSDPGTLGRAEISVRLTLEDNETSGGTDVEKVVQFRGPGDVLKLDPSVIMRVEPVDGIKNLEANYLPCIEFYDTDFLWRYTPGKADPAVNSGVKLRPWLYLIALKPNEFELVNSSGQNPSIILKPGAENAFVNPEDTWAFAHVQCNKDFGDTLLNAGLVLDEIKQNANVGFCRLISPRKLDPAEQYHMFLIPAFEAGRETGLNPKFDFSDTPSLQMSWSLDVDGNVVLPSAMPFYHHWTFSTDDRGDFENLADKIMPKATPPEAGTRDMDIAHSGWDVTCDEETQKVVGLESALMPPSMTSEEFIGIGYNNIYVHRMKQLLNANEVNLTDTDLPSNDVRDTDNQSNFWSTEDPVVVPPLYGQWQTLQRRINFPVPVGEEISPENGVGSKTWMDDLNLDPRWRMTAGIGSDVVKVNQEEFMEEAWEQVEEVNRANQRIRMAQLTTNVSQKIFNKNIKHPQNNVPAAKNDLIRMTANFHKSMLADGTKTIEKELKDSKVPDAALTGAFRRITRPGLKRNKRLNFGDAANSHFAKNIINDFNDASVEESTLSNYYKAAIPLDAKSLVDYDHNGAISKGSANLDNAVTKLVDNTNPKNAIKNLVLSTIETWDEVQNDFVEATELKRIMAYPDFDVPLYEFLERLSTDYIIPNIEKILPNSATLMTLNQRFIEALFVGVNHEMSRELLWREYPTDMRGTYFKNFWDQSDDGNDDYVPEIDEIHTWDSDAKLGAQEGTVSATMILVIRAELLEKFPDVQIYAQSATWDPLEYATEPATIDADTHRIVDASENGIRKLPNLRARVGSEIVLLGFDLTEDEARGMTPSDVYDTYGYYFVLRERPGKVRFGLDDDPLFDPNANMQFWDDMSWQRNGDSALVDVNQFVSPAIDNEDNILWGKSSADMAHILFQKPVMMLIHASEMLMPALEYEGDGLAEEVE